jgi:iron complex outermembrane receptor protein
LLAAAPAFAQEQPAPSAPGDATKLETVVVTSQRRVELLQDVPVAVKAFSAKQIDNMGITSTQDFVNLTPNMSFDNSFTYGNSFVVLRGVTQINNADSPVAVIVDGVPQNNQKQLKMNLFDVERIEVLKGPQGALYGRNAIGGGINIETKLPGNRLEGFVGMELGNGGRRALSGGVSGALKEDVALFRVVGQTLRSDGLIENSFLQRKIDGVDHDNSLRAKLLLRPSNEVQIDLRASSVDFKAGATWDSIVTSGKPADINAPVENLFGKTTGKTSDFSAKVEADFAIGTLTAITAYTKLREDYRGDLDFSNPTALPGGFLGLGFQAGQGQNLNVRMASQELRLTSKANQPLRWIAGLYYLDTRRDLETRAFVDTSGSLDQFDEIAKVIIDNKESNRNKASAVFGQLDYDLRKNLTLSTALRYDRDQRHQTDVIHGSVREASYGKWQPKLTLTNKLSRDELVYGTLSTGFRSGGFNAPGQADFRPESLSNAELGMKTMLLDSRLQLNVAAFASRSKDFQFFYVDASKGAQVISNIDKVDLRGLDLDFRFLPIKGLEFDGGLGITASKIRQDSAEPGAVGHHTPKNVPFKVNFGVQYSQPVFAGVDASVRLDYEHRDKKYWHPDNANVSPALDLWGLRVGLRGAGDRWSVALVGKNLANKRYYADYNAGKYAGLPYDLGSLATPRTYGLEAKWRFE